MELRSTSDWRASVCYPCSTPACTYVDRGRGEGGGWRGGGGPCTEQTLYNLQDVHWTCSTVNTHGHFHRISPDITDGEMKLQACTFVDASVLAEHQ